MAQNYNVSDTFPINRVREQFPALQRTDNGRPVVYFDGPGGSQMAASVIEAITSYMTNGAANVDGPFPTAVETKAMIVEAREAVADLLAVQPQEVAFGANMTTLTFAIARALGRQWGEGDEIVVTEMDHRANVDPWITMAEDRGMTVRWLKVDPQTMTLDLRSLDSIVTNKTRLVAVGMASNAIGTVNDVTAVSAMAKEVGALVAVDAVHAVPHLAIDRDALLADILLCSAYKFFGPHVGIAAIRRDLFEALNTYKLAPAPTTIPGKLETGTQNHEGIAGIKAAIEFIASLGEGCTRRERIVSGYERIEKYEDRLANIIRDELKEIPGVTLYQADQSVKKTPTIAFRIDNMSPEDVCVRMAKDCEIFVADGDFYASTLASVLGVKETGGWVRAGLAPYNTEEEVDRFVAAVKQLVQYRTFM